MTYVFLPRGSVVHVLDEDGTTACGHDAANGEPVKLARRLGRCPNCARAVAIRKAMQDAWKEQRQVNRMALIRELVAIRERNRNDNMQGVWELVRAEAPEPAELLRNRVHQREEQPQRTKGEESAGKR